MYKPAAFAEDRPDVLARAMADIQLAALVTPSADGLVITHVPMVVRHLADQIVLETHVARANPHWRAEPVGPSAAIFQGPQSYVSPSWYPSKQEHGKVVPTWAYIAVHAHGTMETCQDDDWLQQHLNALTDANERDRDAPWQVSDAPDRFIGSLSRGIVGLRLVIDRLEGSWKINQHKSDADQIGTEAGLRSAGPDGAALAAALAQSRD
ncbi:FMN-binding negative transcriptional regulator [Yoonia sp. SDW83-1]|uniref:FMN-binding negative transcriptional regulator n=1 Tax=Yoonia sp. SDW83-1 TaxID=3366945 RepID=UPI00398C4194